MKKIAALFIVLFSITICYAQTYEGIGKTLSVRVLRSYGEWSDWSEPESVEVKVVIDVSKYRVTIYSKSTQVYNMLYSESHYYDNSDNISSECWKYKVLDQEGDTGTLIIRYGKNWMQIYIQFADIQWVYYID